MHGGSKPPIKKPVASNKNIKIEEYRPSNIQEAHQRNQEAAIKHEHTILNNTNKAPIEESKIKEERQTTGQLQGTPSQAEDKIIKEVSYNQPFGVDSIDLPQEEARGMNAHEASKVLLSGLAMLGIGALVTLGVGAVVPLFLTGTCAALMTTTVSAGITSFVGTYVNAYVGAIVDQVSLEEYGQRQGYSKEEHEQKLFVDGIKATAIGMTISATIYLGGRYILNSIADDIAKQVTKQSDDVAQKVVEKSDDVLEVFSESGNTTIPSQQQMHDTVTQWARMEESLANSNRQLDKFNTATVVYDARTGNYYYGMNRGIQLSGDTLNSSLASWLPESSLNQFRLGNCAEVDAVNQALNSGANAFDLYLYTINTKNNVLKPMCENCIYTFADRVADVLSH